MKVNSTGLGKTTMVAHFAALTEWTGTTTPCDST